MSTFPWEVFSNSWSTNQILSCLLSSTSCIPKDTYIQQEGQRAFPSDATLQSACQGKVTAEGRAVESDTLKVSRLQYPGRPCFAHVTYHQSRAWKAVLATVPITMQRKSECWVGAFFIEVVRSRLGNLGADENTVYIVIPHWIQFCTQRQGAPADHISASLGKSWSKAILTLYLLDEPTDSPPN